MARTNPGLFQIDTVDRLNWKNCHHKLHDIKTVAETQATHATTTDAALATIRASLQTLKEGLKALTKSCSYHRKDITNNAGWLNLMFPTSIATTKSDLTPYVTIYQIL